MSANEEELSLELIQDRLRKAINEQSALTARYFEISKEAAKTEGAWKAAYARERYAAVSADSKKVTAPMAHDIAMNATDEMHQAYLMNDAIKDAVKQSLFSNREKQQTLRTLASSYRMLELGGN